MQTKLLRIPNELFEEITLLAKNSRFRGKLTPWIISVLQEKVNDNASNIEAIKMDAFKSNLPAELESMENELAGYGVDKRVIQNRRSKLMKALETGDFTVSELKNRFYGKN